MVVMGAQSLEDRHAALGRTVRVEATEAAANFVLFVGCMQSLARWCALDRLALCFQSFGLSSVSLSNDQLQTALVLG